MLFFPNLSVTENDFLQFAKSFEIAVYKIYLQCDNSLTAVYRAYKYVKNNYFTRGAIRNIYTRIQISIKMWKVTFIVISAHFHVLDRLVDFFLIEALHLQIGNIGNCK